MTKESNALPLTGVRVVELTDGLLDMAGRILADFGADVTKIETVRSRHRRTNWSDARGTDVRFLVENFNKSSIAMDVSDPDDVARLWDLLESADIFIQASHRAADLLIDADEAQARFPRLVVLSVSDSGGRRR